MSFCYSQSKVLYIEYGSSFDDDNGTFTKDKVFGDSFSMAMRESHKLRYGLIINSYGAKFFDLTETIENTLSSNLAKILTNYMGIIYIIDDQVLCQSKILGENIYTKKDLMSDWILTNESKIIDGLACYKATRTINIKNPKGEFTYPVIAWYCPQIPHKYGPNGYGNLPGLILELQVRNVSFFTKKIDFNSDEQFDTNFLKKAKILTEEQFNKKIYEFNDFDKLKK
jgi:GLPGLI family protein